MYNEEINIFALVLTAPHYAAEISLYDVIILFGLRINVHFSICNFPMRDILKIASHI